MGHGVGDVLQKEVDQTQSFKEGCRKANQVGGTL